MNKFYKRTQEYLMKLVKDNECENFYNLRLSEYHAGYEITVHGQDEKLLARVAVKAPKTQNDLPQVFKTIEEYVKRIEQYTNSPLYKALS